MTGAQPKRIVSLIASSTEIIHALGCVEQMVGRSHECDYPESVKKLPILTEVKFQTDGSSYQIDERVKAILQEGLSVYKVKADLLQKLKPDVIVTQIQCAVCAVSQKDVDAAVRQIIDSRPQIVSLEPNALADIWDDIRKVANALDIPAKGEEVVAALQKRVATIAGRAAGLASKPTMACIEWMDPLMAGGNWLPELVELAGGVNLFGAAGKHSPWMTWEEVRKKDPDIIIILPCGFDIARTRREINRLTGRTGWNQLKAVKNNRAFIGDGNQFFNRPGPRVVESLEILAELCHPDIFRFGHKGVGWENC